MAQRILSIVLASRFSWRTSEDEVYLAPVIPKWNNSARARAPSPAKADLNRLEDGPWDGIIGYGKLIEQRDWTEWEAPQSGWESTITPPSCARPGLLRELAQVNCTSFFRAAALRGIYWGPIDFSGEKSIENSIMRFQSERAGRRIYYWRIMQRYLPRTH